MKRILAAALMVASLCFGAVAMTGCSNSEQVIKDALTSELDQIKNHDASVMDEISSQPGMDSLSQLGIEPAQFVESMLTGFDYQIGEVKVDGDTATAQITLTVKNFSSFQDDLTAIVKKMDFSKYKSYDAAMKDVGAEVIKLIDGMEPKTADPFTITYKKEGNTWTPTADASSEVVKAMGMA